MMLLVILVAVAAVIFYLKLRNVYNYWKNKGVQYAKPYFLVGNMSLIPNKSLTQRMRDLYSLFPNERYMGFYEFLVPSLMLRDADLVKQITIKDFDFFADHPIHSNPDVDDVWSKILVNIKGEKWHQIRSTLSPSFTSSKLRSMYYLMDKCAVQMVEHLKEKITSDSMVMEFEAKELFSRFTTDVIASTAFGIECDSLKNPNNEFFEYGKKLAHFGFLRGLKMMANAASPTLIKLFNIKIIPKPVTNYFDSIIRETIALREEKNIVRHDMIHLLTEAIKGNLKDDEMDKKSEGFASVTEFGKDFKTSNKISMDDAVAQAIVFFLAGFDTTSTLLSFMFYDLALNTDVQQKLRNEVHEVMESNNNKVPYEALLSMKYLDMVICESLRMWAPTILTNRMCTKTYTLQPVLPGEKPVVIEKGTHVFIPIDALHYDERYYPNPNKFDPERFNEKNKHNIHQGAYLPFGAGPRNCIGSRFALLEAKLLLVYLLNYFEVVPIKKTLVPMILDKKVFNPQPLGGMWLGFKKLK